MYTINNTFAYGALVFQRNFASITLFDPPTLLMKVGHEIVSIFIKKAPELWEGKLIAS